MMKMVDRGEVYGVLAVQSNRISRNPQERGFFSQKLVSGFITFFLAVVDGRRYSGENSNDIFMFDVEGSMSWKDSKDKGTNIADRMHQRAKEGKHMGRKPFGYKPKLTLQADGYEERTTIEDEERLPFVQRMYQLAGSGWSLKEIEKWLDDHNVRARPTENNSSGYLGRTAIAHILHDPYYKGYVGYKGEEHLWTDNPPVPVDLWNRVQIIMAHKQSHSGPQNAELRKMFWFGNAMTCGKCGGCLSPYKVEKKKAQKIYIYYECKNDRTHCQVCIPQDVLLERYGEVVERCQPDDSELQKIKRHLIKLHNEKWTARKQERVQAQKEYEKVEEQIRKQLAAMPDAKDMGFEIEAKEMLMGLKERRDTLKTQLDAVHDEGTAWIDKFMGCFELIKVAEELLKYGSPRVRAKTLKAIASNYPLINGKLVPDLRSPFKEAMNRVGLPEWWAIQDSNL